ncbi:MAG: TerC family protein [Cytophagaceae bacterium]|jgi:predicted tellurium resistance membrane protein TerC|nr:TerC family protein [Cytophagaceae bacterium]
MNLEVFLTLDGWLSLLTLALMEIILGIDNIIFISIISDRLPKEMQKQARLLGISGALIIRVILLSFIFQLAHMIKPLFSIMGNDFSWRDIILIAGGLFLVYKSTTEIFHNLEGEDDLEEIKPMNNIATAITQIILLDIVFSFDSILTAIGMSNSIIIMIIAVVISMVVMLLFAKAISEFINKHPSVKVLALAFLLTIGVLLIAEGFDQHVPKGYIYSAMFFSLLVELLNMYARKRREAAKLIKDEEK